MKISRRKFQLKREHEDKERSNRESQKLKIKKRKDGEEKNYRKGEEEEGRHPHRSHSKQAETHSRWKHVGKQWTEASRCTQIWLASQI